MSLPQSFHVSPARSVSPNLPQNDDAEEISVPSPVPQPQPLQPSYTEKSSGLEKISFQDTDGTAARSPPVSSTFEQNSSSLMLNDSNVRPSDRHPPCDPPRIYRLQSNTQRLIPQWVMAFSAICISIFSIYFAYTVLVSEAEVPKSLYLEPSNAVLVANILSHVVAFLCWNLFSDATEALRWAMACREEGVLLTTFLALSRATPFAGVFYLCFQKGSHQIWAIQRITSLVLVTIMGLILLTNVTYKNVYNSSTNTDPLPVVSGVAPLRSDLLALAPVDLLSLYAISFNMGFITDTKYVVSQPALTCDSTDCMSLFLPGSLVLLRVADGLDYQNHTVFGKNIPGDYTTIVVENAPGLQLDFVTMKRGHNFTNNDCRTYGLSNSAGLYICLASDGPSMLAGWNVCSSFNCTQDTSWHTIDAGINVTAFRRFADTAYDRQNASILSIEKIGEPSIVPINPADFRKYHDIILAQTPQVLNQSDGLFAGEVAGYAVQSVLEGLLNTYKAQFGLYTNGGLDLLKGFLCVAIQFNSLLWEILSPQSIPDDLKTIARLQRSSYRAIAHGWNVYIFGGMAFVMLFWSVGCLLWVCLRLPASPNSSAFPEIDIVSKISIGHKHAFNNHGKSGGMAQVVLPDGKRVDVVVEEEPLEDLGKLTRSMGLGNGVSSAVLSGIKGTNIYCAAYNGDFGGGDVSRRDEMIVIVTDRDRDVLRTLKKGASYS